MKVKMDTEGLTLKRLQKDLQRRFRGYRFTVFGRTLMVSRSLLEGCGVVIGNGVVKVHVLPASLGSLLLLAALGALFILPGLVYLLVLFVRSQSLVQEIGDSLAAP